MTLEGDHIEEQGMAALQLQKKLHSVDNPREKKEVALRMLRKLHDDFIWNSQIIAIAIEPLGLLITNQRKIELIAQGVGMVTNWIPWNEATDLSWREVLQAAENQGLIKELIEAVLNSREKITLTDEERQRITEITGEIQHLANYMKTQEDLVRLQQLTDDLSRLAYGI